MSPFNATVIGGFIGRDGKIRLTVKPDKGDARQVLHSESLDEGKRVKLDGAVIVGVQ